MPIYEYRCAKCGDFDVTQKITEKPLKKCPTCKGKVAKLISSPAFHLKGSGWYVTDYAGKKGGGAMAALVVEEVRKLHEQAEALQELLKTLFKGVFIERYRDVCEEVISS